MKVELISYSKPAEDFPVQNADLQDLVAYCARVSNPSNQMNTETTEKLLGYLQKNAHWSPFEMVSVCLEIETTRDIARQILRHRSFSFQEFSQRYSTVDEFNSYPYVLREMRLQDFKNRQNSIEVDLDDFGKGGEGSEQTKYERMNYQWLQAQRKVIDAANEAYHWAIDNGIAKEQARAVLPEGLTKSRMYMNGTLRSWIHYIELRRENGTQKEHALIAKECAKVISEIYKLV